MQTSYVPLFSLHGILGMLNAMETYSHDLRGIDKKA